MTCTTTYKIIDLFSHEEWQLIRDLLQSRIRKELGVDIKLQEYHNFVSHELHAKLSSKRKRVLNNDEATQLLRLQGIQRLLSTYPNYQICNVVFDSLSQDTRPEFHFRIVRPNQSSDVGTPHCDFWFYEAMNTRWGKNDTIKFWIPIVTEKGKNGLLFYPNAPSSVPFHIIEKGNLSRPLISIDLDELGPPILPSLKYGQAIMFLDDVIHCGALNLGRKTRVSLEITLAKSV